MDLLELTPAEPAAAAPRPRRPARPSSPSAPARTSASGTTTTTDELAEPRAADRVEEVRLVRDRAQRDPLAPRRRAASPRPAATSFVASPPTSATQKTNASAPSSSTTSHLGGDPVRRRARAPRAAGRARARSSRPPRGRPDRLRQRTVTPPSETRAVRPERHGAEVHRRRADEAGDERVHRALVQLARRVALLQQRRPSAPRRGGRASSPPTGRA